MRASTAVAISRSGRTAFSAVAMLPVTTAEALNSSRQAAIACRRSLLLQPLPLVAGQDVSDKSDRRRTQDRNTRAPAAGPCTAARTRSSDAVERSRGSSSKSRGLLSVSCRLKREERMEPSQARGRNRARNAPVWETPARRQISRIAAPPPELVSQQPLVVSAAPVAAAVPVLSDIATALMIGAMSLAAIAAPRRVA